MTTPLTPGVYVREAPGGARAIEAAPTAVTIFFGETERGPQGPTAISSALQFQRLFGGYFRPETAGGTTRLFMPYAVQGFFDNGGPRAYVLRLIAPDGANQPAQASATLNEVRFVDLPNAAVPPVVGRIVQRRALVPTERLRIVIENATNGVATDFNLRVQQSVDSGTTFANRAVNPTLANLSTNSALPDFILTRLALDPDIAWEGPPVRPVNLPAGIAGVLRGTGGTTQNATMRARAAGVWGNDLRIAISNSTDRDPARFNLTIWYRAVGETNFNRVEVFEGLSVDPTDEKYMIDQIARSAYVAWGNLDPLVVFRPGNLGALEGGTPGVLLAGGVGGAVSFPAASYGTALRMLDGIDDAALIICAADQVLNTTDATVYNTLLNAVIGYVEARPQRDLFLIGDAPRSTADLDPVGAAVAASRTGITASDHRALYWPRIVVADPAGVGRNPVRAIPASGHIAGLYGRTDGRRGVWKVAAGLEATVTGAVGLDFQVLDQHQDRMNPHGLNALRTIPGAGRVIWGARTGRPTTEWRYINVRRTAMFLRRSIYNGIQWAVFEGNDERLWAALRSSIGAFMEAQFRNGAFAGATSREAFFVKCDADTTTADDQAAGIVNVQVGFAPLRPAEFVIVTLSQMTRR